MVSLVALLGAGASGRGPAPVGLPPVPIPAENPLTPAKVALGERLFFETGFSIDRRVSCAGCHRPEGFFVDEERFSKGILGLDGARNTGSVLNAAYSPFLMSDGRATSLEDQVKYPVTNPLELNTTQERVVSFLAGEPAYAPLFAAAFGDASVTWKRVTEAIASFERTLIAGNSAFDRFMAGDGAALSAPAQRGWELFRGEAGCVRCHAYRPDQPFFSDFEFHNTGVAWYPDDPQPSVRHTPDLGRYWVTRDRQHIGAFRTPGLRNVARTAPYMRNGELATLAQVVEFYSKGPRKNPFLDARLEPLALTAGQQADLVAFLESLTGEVGYQRPASPGEGAPPSPAAPATPVSAASASDTPTSAAPAKPSPGYGRIEVVAGGGDDGDGGKAMDAVFVNVGGLAADPKGNLYVVDSGANRVRRIDAETGLIRTVAGTGLMVGALDSQIAIDRPLRGPVPLAIDGPGRSLFVGEILSRRVLRVDLASGAIEDLGGPAGGFGSPDGLLWTPAGLLVADAPRGQVWRQGVGGAWTGLLSAGSELGDNIRTLAQDSRGRVYVSEYFAHRVLRWDPATGDLEVVVGTGQSGRGADGLPAPQAAIRTPDGIALDRNGHLLVADKGNHRICRVDLATGVLETVAESREKKGSEKRWTPGPIAADAQGNLWIGDLESNRLLRLAPGASEPVVMAGAGGIGDGGAATAARLAHPGSVVADARGDLYVSDTLHHRVRVIEAATGRIRTLAGTGMHGYNGDGIPATQAWLSYPAELQIDGKGRIYFGDYYNNRVRVVDPATGLISTLAGSGKAGEDGDGGPATGAKLFNPHALLLEGDRSLLIASAVSSRVRRVDLESGTISSVAMGDGVPADLAFYGMAHWAGGVVMARPRPGSIEVLRDGKLTPLLDRPDVFFPQDVTVSPRGELFVCETGRNRVMRWTGKNLEPVVENLGRPGSISFDSQGNLLISDTFHNRVLKVWLAPEATAPRSPVSP